MRDDTQRASNMSLSVRCLLATRVYHILPPYVSRINRNDTDQRTTKKENDISVRYIVSLWFRIKETAAYVYRYCKHCNLHKVITVIKHKSAEIRPLLQTHCSTILYICLYNKKSGTSGIILIWPASAEIETILTAKNDGGIQAHC